MDDGMDQEQGWAHGQPYRGNRTGGLIAAVVLVVLCVIAGLAAQSALGAAPPGLSASPSSSVSPSPSPSPSGFDGSIARLTEQEKRWMTGHTWHKGCPVPPEALRLLRFNYNDFDGNIVPGRMVVNRRVAEGVLGVFEAAFDGGFQFEHVDATDLYKPAERPDKLRNVTSAFNCRFISGTSTWSQHAFGLAVDVNPVQNPWVHDGSIIPGAGRDYVDRSQRLPGMLRRGGVVVQAFFDLGWGWGGTWHSVKDYMHFSRTGH